MIWESWHWKQPLLATAERLKQMKEVADPSEEQLVQLEKDVFIGFYSIRKLFETVAKVTDSTKQAKVALSWHPNVKSVTRRNSHKLNELYDLSSVNNETRDIWFISGRIIHSYIFAPMFGEPGGLKALLFTSDRDKDQKLYSLHVDRVIELFELVGNDDPTEIHSRRDPETGAEIIEVK